VKTVNSTVGPEIQNYDLTPEFPDNAEWINTTRPLTLRELRGI